jgi:hypothetical protein
MEQFDNPTYWAKITLHAFGIKKQTYFDVGGFAHRYNRFAYWIFGADFHRMGYSLGYAPGVGVAHLFVDSFKPLDHFFAECVSGEVQFRLTENNQYYESYFGKPREWFHLQKYNPELSKTILHVCFSLYVSGEFPNKLLFKNTLSTAFFYCLGKPYFWGFYNLPRLVHKSCVFFSRKKSNASWSHFFNYAQKSFIWYRVKYALQQKQNTPRKINLQSHYVLSQVNEFDLYGFHDIEYHQNTAFRWSQSLSAVRLYLNPESQLIRIQLLDNIRQIKTHSELCCFINEVRIDEFELNESKDEIILKLPQKYQALDTGYWLILFSKPWLSKLSSLKQKNNEKRTLGLPIKEIRLECLTNVLEKGISV